VLCEFLLKILFTSDIHDFFNLKIAPPPFK
jgi:hypothetical protein